MNHELHLRAFRDRAAGTFCLRNTSGNTCAGVRPRVPIRPRAAPLRAQWSRNAMTGVLECRWVIEEPVEPHACSKATRVAFKTRVRALCRKAAGMHPPSRQYIHG